MMNGWMALDRLAAERGDGLDPALRELLDARAATNHPAINIVDMTERRGERQSGPVARTRLPGRLPENVIRFPGRDD